jgi:hypothetical protein
MTNRFEQLDAGDIGVQDLHAIPYRTGHLEESLFYAVLQKPTFAGFPTL